MKEDLKIKEIIKRLQEKKNKQMNTYFKQFYTETIKMLNDEFLKETES
jgi:hypothetical protein